MTWVGPVDTFRMIWTGGLGRSTRTPTSAMKTAATLPAIASMTLPATVHRRRAAFPIGTVDPPCLPGAPRNLSVGRCCIAGDRSELVGTVQFGVAASHTEAAVPFGAARAHLTLDELTVAGTGVELRGREL